MAQDAQLLLKVGLDLSTFRSQLATLGQAAAGYNLPIKIKFDRIAVQNELNALGVNIKRRTYRLEVATNIKAETENAKILAKALAELGKAGQQIRGVAGRAATGTETSTVDAAKFQAMVNRATKPALEALYQGMAKAKIPMAEVGGRTIDELKKSIISGIPGITQDIANGMTKGLEGLKESGRKGARFVIDSFKDAAGIASPSKVFKQLGQFSAEGLEDGFLEGLRDFKGKAVSEIRKIVALMRMELATLGGAASSAVAVAGGGVRGSGRGGTQYMSPIGPLPHGSREPWAYNQGAYRYEPYMAQPGQFRGAGVQSMTSRYPFAPMPRVRTTTELPSMFGVARPALPAAGMSSAAGMRQAELFAREAAARARSAERNAAVMRESAIASRVSGQVPLGRGGFPQLPSGTGGAFALRDVGGRGGGGGTGGGGGGGGGRRPSGDGDFLGGLGRLSLPGAGTIRELGSEFAFATKQVLLFGQAYKLLAFVQDFPGQVGQAVGQLQSFRNTLNAISPSAAEAAKSNEFILSIVDKYNVPIQSARDGFTKLYASMEPAGFRGEEIRGLFKSISMGAATFGMSADKVDRVIYAFSQMASKGQVMSEELKGQLGDVLPGSMALFAEAAGFKGPDAISKFSAALEDGVYKGENMVKLLKNVRVVMEQEFGPGAEGAALTFQGGINRMQNSLRQLYEAFEPVAVNFMNQVVKPLTDGLRTAADGFTAFLQGVAAKTPQGAAFAQELEKLRPALEGIGNNLKALLPTFELFGNILLNVGKVLLAIAGNPITGFLLKVYTNVLLVNTVFGLLGGKVLIGLISNIGAAIARFIALNIQMGLLQKTTAVANSSLAGTQLQMALLTRNAGAALGPVGLLKTSLMGLARIGLIAIAIQVAIDGMAEIDRLKKSLADIAGFSSKEYKKEVQGLSREEVNSRIIVNRRSQAQAQKELQAFAGPMGAAMGLITGRDRELRERLVKYQIQEAVLQGARGNKTQSQLMRSQLGGALEPITGGGESRAKGGAKEASKAAEDARKLADDRRKYEADLMKLNAQQAIELDSMYFEQWKTLQDKKFDYMDAGQNEWMKREIKFQRDLQAIELRRIEAVFRAQSASRKAAIDAESAAYAGGGATGATGATGLLQGSTGTSSGPHFHVARADGSRISEAEARALFDSTIRRQLQMTSGYGPRRAPTRGASTFHRGIDLAGPANTPLNLAPGYSLQSAGMQGGLGYAANVRGPQGQMYQVGHLQQPGGNLPASRIRKEAKQDYSANLAAQEAINAKQREALSILHANQQAQQEINILIREYVASIAPVEQQKLENSLLQDRINLIVGGLSGEALDAEIAISKARKQSALGIEEARKAITEYEGKIKDVNQAVRDKKITTDEAARSVQFYRDAISGNERKIKDLTVATQEYLPLLREQLHLAQPAAEAELRRSITRATPLGGTGLAGGFIGAAGAKFEEALSRGASREEATRFAELQNQLTLLEKRNAAIESSILGIGDAFATAMTTGVASLVDGTASAEEVFANFLNNVGQALIQAAQEMIATYIAIGIARIFAGLQSPGGASNVFGPGGAPNYSGAFGLGGDFGSAMNMPLLAANGAVWQGGFQAFADGGMVTGPTLGLVGEGKYNEAIVPLPDGRSIPVQLQDSSVRDRMNGSSSIGTPVLNMNFQSQTINGVEYVSRDQLEAAMAETRRQASRDGAQRGMTMTLDRLQQSPRTRSRLGMR